MLARLQVRASSVPNASGLPVCSANCKLERGIKPSSESAALQWYAIHHCDLVAAFLPSINIVAPN